MARIHGIAGEWARVTGTVLGLWPLFVAVAIFGFAVGVGFFASSGWGASLAILAVVGGLFAWVRGLRRVERFFTGARGEERVSGLLKGLPDDYHVFNDFRAGRLHVDHVVVGPAGVFAVETKFWREAVTVEDGHILAGGHLPSREPLGQVLREAAAVRRTLAAKGWNGTVTPILAFASDTFTARMAEHNGAVVMNAREIPASFTASREILSANDVARLVGLMEAES